MAKDEKKLVPLDLDSAKKGYAKFLKNNDLEESETPADSELAAKKASWEEKIASLQSKGKKAGKVAKKEKAAKAPRESKKYSYPKGVDSPEDRKKFRAKARAEANGGGKKAKAAKPAKAEKAKGSKKKAAKSED